MTALSPLGTPRLHLRVTDSTNLRARELAVRGAPHGTLVTAGRQDAGRGRQGRSWSAPAGRSLLMSLVVRDPSPLLPLAAGVAVADVIADVARPRHAPDPAAGVPDGLMPAVAIKWPNDVELGGRKVAGILVEARPQDRWAVLGIGLNVAVELADLPEPLRARAGTLGLAPAAIEPLLGRLLETLAERLAADAEAILDGFRARDALIGRPVAWSAGAGTAAGVDADGRLLVETEDGPIALDAGEVHLQRPTPP